MKKFLIPSIYDIIIILFAITLLIKTDIDVDTIWHISIGKYINNPFKIPSFSNLYFTEPDKEEMNLQWLSDLIFYRLYNVSPLMLRIFQFVLFLSWLILLVKIFRKSNINPILSSIILFLILFNILIFRSIRPLFLGYFIFNILIYILFFTDRKYFNLIPLIFLIWVNIHPSFVLGFYTLIIYSIFIRIKNSKWDKKFFLVIISSIIISLINPYFIKVFKIPFILLKDLTIYENITEWQTGFDIFSILYLIVLFFLIGISKISLPDIIFFCSFFYFPFLGTRFIPVLLIASLPIITDILKKIKIERESFKIAEQFNSFIFSIPFIFIIFIIFIFINKNDNLLKLGENKLVFEAIQNSTNIDFTRIYVYYLWTGLFLLLNDDENKKIFFDLKEPYTLSNFNSLLVFEQDTYYWKGLVKIYGIDGFILPKNHKMVRHIYNNKEWLKVFENEKVVVYKKNRKEVL